MNEILITPQIDPKELESLSRASLRIDKLLDGRGKVQPIGAMGVLEPYGSRLWEAAGLDAEEIREGLETAKTNGSLLQLAIEGEDYHHLPWETLYHEHPEIGFIGRHSWCTIVRKIRSAAKKPAKLQPLPLRVLLFISSPEDLDPERSRLDYEKEEELLYEALDRQLSEGSVDIDVAEDGTLETLVERLENNYYHAVILSMHGTRGAAGNGDGEWGLLFEDGETGLRQAVVGSDLQAEFEKLPMEKRPGLVVLSACRSAAVEETAESITSVALKLHGTIDRVLGMRLSIMDGAASAFSTEFFRRLAMGESCGRAMSLARNQVAEGGWLSSGKGKAAGDPFAQWMLPVLYDATDGGALADTEQSFEKLKRRPLPRTMIAEGEMKSVNLPDRKSFVGRRRQVREYLRPFMKDQNAKLFFSGPGGVGKTTLAGMFVRRLLEREPEVRLFGFRAPFDLDTVYETLHTAIFKYLDANTLSKLQNEKDQRKRINLLLGAIVNKQPTVFLLDNLESLQDIETLKVKDKHTDSLFFLRAVCRLAGASHVLLTGRYRFVELDGAGIEECSVPDAPYGDVLRRMQRLNWPEEYGMKEKREVYHALGGNHRAIEWLGLLLVPTRLGERRERPEELIESLRAVKAPAGTPEAAIEAVQEAMRQNLLLDELREVLGGRADRLLRAMALYRVPVTTDGIYAVAEAADTIEGDIELLLDHALLESGVGFIVINDRVALLDVFDVPPIVKELLADEEWEQGALERLHKAIGWYHRHQGKYVSRRWSDYLEAIHHLRLAGEDAAADELAERVCGYYYGISSYSDCLELTRPIVLRETPAVPWWSLNRQGMCLKSMGDYDEARKCYEKALPLAELQGDKGVILGNMATIAHAKGDYEGALGYMKESLKILQGIENKQGESTTLNNISQIYRVRGDYETALKYSEQDLSICREIGDKAGEGTTLNNIGQIYGARGDYDKALEYWEQSLKISQEIGDKAGEGVTLNNISQIYRARGENERALEYLEQSLKINQEIGDKAGTMPTLHNMALIAMEGEDVEKAIGYWTEALGVAQETQDAMGMFHVSFALGRVLAMAGHADGVKMMEEAIAIGKQCGFPQTEGMEQELAQIKNMKGGQS